MIGGGWVWYRRPSGLVHDPRWETHSPAATAAEPPVITPVPSPAYTELSSAITRALTPDPEMGDALTTAGQALTGLSGALADVVAAVATMPEVHPLTAREADLAA